MFRWLAKDLIIDLYVQPNASQNKVVGVFQDHLKVQITAPANENKANRHLQKWLSKEFKVPLSQVVIEKGLQSRYKVVRVKEPNAIPNWLI